MTTPADMRAVVEGNIAQLGVHVNFIMDEVPFAYTIGLARRGHEELLISGLLFEHGMAILNQVSHMILEAGAVLRPGDRFALAPGKAELLLLEVDDQVAHDVACWAWSCNPDIPVHVLQVVYPDLEGHFPWEGGSHPEHVAGQTIYGKRLDA